MQEMRVWSPGWKDPLREEVASHSSVLAGIIPWTERPGRLQSMESPRVRHDLATKLARVQSGPGQLVGARAVLSLTPRAHLIHPHPSCSPPPRPLPMTTTGPSVRRPSLCCLLKSLLTSTTSFLLLKPSSFAQTPWKLAIGTQFHHPPLCGLCQPCLLFGPTWLTLWSSPRISAHQVIINHITCYLGPGSINRNQT